MTFQNVISKVSKWQLDVLVLSFRNCSNVGGEVDNILPMFSWFQQRSRSAALA